jgi:hypothetical protein
MSAISEHQAAKMAQAEAEAAALAAAARVKATEGAAKVEAGKQELARKRRVETATDQIAGLEKRLVEANAMKAALPGDVGLRAACRSFIADPSRVSVLHPVSFHVPKVQHLTDSLGMAAYLRNPTISDLPAELGPQLAAVEGAVRKSLVETVRALAGEL